jgi:hypothetical protein
MSAGDDGLTGLAGAVLARESHAAATLAGSAEHQVEARPGPRRRTVCS